MKRTPPWRIAGWSGWTKEVTSGALLRWLAALQRASNGVLPGPNGLAGLDWVQLVGQTAAWCRMLDPDAADPGPHTSYRSPAFPGGKAGLRFWARIVEHFIEDARWRALDALIRLSKPGDHDRCREAVLEVVDAYWHMDHEDL